MSTNSAGSVDDSKHLLVATSRKLSKEYRQLYGLLTGSQAPPYTIYRSEDSFSDSHDEDDGNALTSTTGSATSATGGGLLSTIASSVYTHSANVVYKTVGGWSTTHPPTNPNYLAPPSLQAAVYLPISDTPVIESFLVPLLLRVSKGGRSEASQKTKKEKGGGDAVPTRKRLQKLVWELSVLTVGSQAGDASLDAKREGLRSQLYHTAMSYALGAGVGQLADSLSRLDSFTSAFLTEVAPLLKSNNNAATTQKPKAGGPRVFPIKESTYEAAFTASEAVDSIVVEIDRRGSLVNQLLLVCDHLLSSSSTNGAVSNNSGVWSYLGYKATSPSSDTSASASTSQYLFDLCVKGYTGELRGRCRDVLSMSAVDGGRSALMNHLAMVKQAASAVVENGFDGLGVPTAPSYENVFDAESEGPSSFTSFHGSAGDLPSNVQLVRRENGFNSEEDGSPSQAPVPPPISVGKDPQTQTSTAPSQLKKAPSKQQSQTPRQGGTSSAVSKRPSLKEMKRVASSAGLPEGRRTAIEEQRVVLQDGTSATLFVEVPLDELDLHAEQQRHREIEEIAKGMAEVNELQALINQHTIRQEENIATIEKAAGVAQVRAAAGRMHLTQASKYQVVGAVVAGAVIGAAVGGPIGLLIGAKSIATVGGALALGGVTGGVGAKVVTSASAKNASHVDDDYEDRRERGEL
jgi:hypothetical protein